MSKIALRQLRNINGNPRSAQGALNDNFSRISTAIDKLTSRDGEDPNARTTPLDMNSFRAVNSFYDPEPPQELLQVRLGALYEFSNAAGYANAAFDNFEFVQAGELLSGNIYDQWNPWFDSFLGEWGFNTYDSSGVVGLDFFIRAPDSVGTGTGLKNSYFNHLRLTDVNHEPVIDLTVDGSYWFTFTNSASGAIVGGFPITFRVLRWRWAKVVPSVPGVINKLTEGSDYYVYFDPV